MPFSSLLFLSGFLPLFLLFYWCSPSRAKNGVALLFSVLFYAWAAPGFLPFVLALGVLDFFLGHAVARSEGRRRKLLLAVGVVIHLSALGYFKYANFFVAQTNAALSFIGVPALRWTEVILPIGISFITFEEISYLVDVYRGDARPPRSLWQYLLFLMLFPHSIAGPIFRWKDLEAQLANRTHSTELVVSGFTRFCMGLGKKVLIANQVAIAADTAFGLPASQLGPSVAWVGALAYTLQIYFDFSGYSDMAIGLGRMAGFRFKENFNHPYISASITEFWRRWHISLSTWLRDYLYIPLGGGRGSPGRVKLNVFLVFLLSGFWHGANWTFVVWGAYHGLLVVAERGGPLAELRRTMPKAVNVALTLLAVVVGWVFFRAESIGSAFAMLRAMAGQGPTSGLVPAEWCPNRVVFTALAGAALALAPLLSKREGPSEGRLATALAPLALLLSMAHLANSKFNPLIYFKF